MRWSRRFWFQRQLAINDQWLAADEARRVVEIAPERSSGRGFVASVHEPIGATVAELRRPQWLPRINPRIGRLRCGEGRIEWVHEILLRSFYFTDRLSAA
jgi:hypothetical protein